MLSYFGAPICLSPFSGNTLLALIFGLPSQGHLLPLAAPSTRCNIIQHLRIGRGCVFSGQGLGIRQRFLRSQDVCSKEHIWVIVFEKCIHGTVLKEQPGGPGLILILLVCEPWNSSLWKCASNFRSSELEARDFVFSEGFLLDLGDRGLFKFILMSRDLTHTLGSKVSFPVGSPSTDSCYLKMRNIHRGPLISW